MLSKINTMEQEIKLLRGDVQKSCIGEVVDNVTPDMIESVLNENNNDIMVFAQIKDEITVGTVGGGFKFTPEMDVLKGKTLHIYRTLKRNRTEEDVKRGGRLGTVYGFKCKRMDDDRVIEHGHTIDDEFITNIVVVSFKNKPFSERIDAINDYLVKNCDNEQDKLEDMEEEFGRKQRGIEEIRERLTRRLKELKNFNAQLEDLRKRMGTKDFKTDLEMLSAHKLFVDLEIDSDYIVFTTDYINMYDPNNIENVFLGNKFEIRVRLKDSRVKFKGLDESRSHKSYWSSSDPHPHVSGRDGDACLGNVSSTLAELCSSNEVYALFTVLVNFLQTFNTDDVAGKNIGNWEMADGSDNPYDTAYKCSICQERIEDGDEVYRCSDCGAVLCEDHAQWHNEDEEYYCQTHYNEHTYVCTECNERYQNEDDINYCTECGDILCSTHTHWDSEDRPYCETHLPVEEEEEEEEEEEAIEETPTVAGAKCDDCGKELAMGESISWVENIGTLLELCEDCMKVREERL